MMDYPGKRLKPCPCRRSWSDDDSRFFCAHPRVHATNQLVTSAVCQNCRFADEPAPDTFRPMPGGLDASLRQRPEIQLVVARYKEDICWLKHFPDFEQVVYDKGDPDAERPLPNIGREAHTYLHHILQHYNDLAEVTVFLQGNPFEHFDDLYEKVYALDVGVRFQNFCDAVLAETADGVPFQPGIDLTHAWRDLFEEEPPEFFLCRASACFAVHRDVIRARPRSFYESLMQHVLEYDLGAWWIERHWHRVFQEPPTTGGIVTAADETFFPSLQFLIRSLETTNSQSYPICVIDLGMTDNQRDWCRNQPGVFCKSIPFADSAVDRMRRYHWWQVWLKPFYLEAAPFDRVLWIDADCTVLSDVSEAFALLDEQPLMIRDACPTRVQNDAKLYQALPVPDDADLSTARVNAGVVGLCKQRDRELLAAWCWGVQWAATHPQHHSSVAFADQGMLLWALHRLRLTHVIRRDMAWNVPSGEAAGLLVDAARNGSSILEEIRQRYPGAKLVHWLGIYKLADQLKAELERLFQPVTADPITPRLPPLNLNS